MSTLHKLCFLCKKSIRCKAKYTAQIGDKRQTSGVDLEEQQETE